MNIVVSGLTASGKTTHARLLAGHLGYDYVSASEIMLSKLNVPKVENNSTWISKASLVERLRDLSPVDRLTNETLVAEFGSRQSTVFDSWALPWLVDEPCVRIWIESTLASRVLKARVSQEPRGPFLNFDDCEVLLTKKDNSSARRLQPLVGGDIRDDRSVFEIVADNSDFISHATIADARRGIARFHDRLVESVIPKIVSGVELRACQPWLVTVLLLHVPDKFTTDVGRTIAWLYMREGIDLLEVNMPVGYGPEFLGAPNNSNAR